MHKMYTVEAHLFFRCTFRPHCSDTSDIVQAIQNRLVPFQFVSNINCPGQDLKLLGLLAE